METKTKRLSLPTFSSACRPQIMTVGVTAAEGLEHCQEVVTVVVLEMGVMEMVVKGKVLRLVGVIATIIWDILHTPCLVKSYPSHNAQRKGMWT